MVLHCEFCDVNFVIGVVGWLWLWMVVDGNTHTHGV